MPNAIIPVIPMKSNTFFVQKSKKCIKKSCLQAIFFPVNGNIVPVGQFGG
jgi:hypothetical protein